MTDHQYTTPTMDAIWSRDAQIVGWGRIESALLSVLVPALRRPSLQIPAAAVATRETSTGHEVGAFLELCELALDAPEHKRWLHFGLTSSDLVETERQLALYASTLQLACIADTLAADIRLIPEVPVVGRTHGQPASPTSYRHRWVTAASALDRLAYWEIDLPVAKLSGAVGRWRVLDQKVAEQVASELGMTLQHSTTQVMPSYVHTQYVDLWRDLVTVCEQVALDARLGAMLGEVVPKRHRVGSTAMPGKVNPIKAEQICGLAKLWRGYYSAHLESRALWLDRDLHHSSLDRITYAQMAKLAAYIGERTDELVSESEYLPSPTGGLGTDADALLGLATWAFAAPRSELYYRVSEIIQDQATIAGALASMAGWNLPYGDWNGDIATLTQRYQDCYGG